MSQYRYIAVSGYHATGSSAVVDLLQECEGFYVPEREFRYIMDPHGIASLDRDLNHPIAVLNKDIACREFLRLVRTYSRRGDKFHSFGLNDSAYFGESLVQLAEEYIDKLTDYHYKGYWWFLDYDKSRMRWVLDKGLRKLGLCDYRKNCTMRLYQKTEEEFVAATQEFLDRIFIELLKKEKKQYDSVVIDNGLNPLYPQAAKRYFDTDKWILVDRDPRDVYVYLLGVEKKKGWLMGDVGFDVSQSHNTQLFIDWFKEYRKPVAGDEGILRIRFEDLILHYDDTVHKIFQYLDIAQSAHVRKGAYLKPEISRRGIGTWENYEHPNEIRMIEQALGSYLYCE